VARTHYVHPHVLESLTANRFDEYLQACTVTHSKHLDPDACTLLAFLKVLLDREFGERFDRKLISA